jgi:hypothetical protein
MDRRAWHIMETPEPAPSGLPNEDVEGRPLGPQETDPDADAPPADDLPGIPEPGTEPPTDG